MKITHCFRRIREIAGGAVAMLAGIMFAIVGSLAAAPAAHAQIVPASLTHEAVAESKIPSSVTLLPLPRIEPRKPVADTHKWLFFAMSAGVYAAAGLDMQDDPLGQAARRFAHAGVLRRRSVVCHGRELAGLENGAVARWHKIWWVPQVTSIAGNLATPIPVRTG
jgi:hypothetical protein